MCIRDSLEVEQGLSYLNEAFSNTGNFKTNNGVDVEIQFCLAVRDPSGMPTSGITRTESNLVADPMPCSPYGTSSVSYTHLTLPTSDLV